MLAGCFGSGVRSPEKRGSTTWKAIGWSASVTFKQTNCTCYSQFSQLATTQNSLSALVVTSAGRKHPAARSYAATQRYSRGYSDNVWRSVPLAAIKSNLERTRIRPGDLCTCTWNKWSSPGEICREDNESVCLLRNQFLKKTQPKTNWHLRRLMAAQNLCTLKRKDKIMNSLFAKDKLLVRIHICVAFTMCGCFHTGSSCPRPRLKVMHHPVKKSTPSQCRMNFSLRLLIAVNNKRLLKRRLLCASNAV